MSVQNHQLLLKNNEYAIRIVTTEDKPAIHDFINKYFYTAEPLNEAANSARNETSSKKSEDFPMLYLLEGLTLMAVESSGELIGVALNAEVKLEQETSDNSASSSNLDTIHKLLNHVEEKITELSNQTNKTKEMEVRVIAVHENWRNKGIGRVLLEHSKNLAKQKGFEQIRSICTSAYTAKMFVNSGFKCIYSFGYKNCQEKGMLDYLPKEPHTHVNGVVLKF